MATFVHGTVCNAVQYEQSQAFKYNPNISCLSHGESIGLAVSTFIPSVFVSISSNLQIAAEASLISSISIIVIFIWIGVRSISFHISLLFDEMLLHSGMCGGIGRRFQTATGS